MMTRSSPATTCCGAGLGTLWVHAGAVETPVHALPLSVHPAAQLPVNVDAQSSITAPQSAADDATPSTTTAQASASACTLTAADSAQASTSSTVTYVHDGMLVRSRALLTLKKNLRSRNGPAAQLSGERAQRKGQRARNEAARRTHPISRQL